MKLYAASNYEAMLKKGMHHSNIKLQNEYVNVGASPATEADYPFKV